MRLAATATGTTLESAFDPKFGRCQHFLLVETSDLSVTHLPNPHRGDSGGTGPRCVQLLVGEGVNTLLTGEVGPNARMALEAAGISVVTGCSGSIADTVAQMLSNQARSSE